MPQGDSTLHHCLSCPLVDEFFHPHVLNDLEIGSVAVVSEQGGSSRYNALEKKNFGKMKTY